MPEYKFNNEHDMIIFALSAILDQLERKDQLFAARCVWWLASIIQDTNMLLFYRRYNIFPSYYVKNCIVTPTSEANKGVLSDQELPELELAESSIEDSEHLSLRSKPNTTKTVLEITRSGRVFKPQKLNQKELKRRYPGRSNKQVQAIRNSLRKDCLIL